MSLWQIGASGVWPDWRQYLFSAAVDLVAYLTYQSMDLSAELYGGYAYIQQIIDVIALLGGGRNEPLAYRG
jgi:hypothetical protein